MYIIVDNCGVLVGKGITTFGHKTNVGEKSYIYTKKSIRNKLR